MASNAKTALLCAYTLARAKQYSEAETLILSHEELSKTPEALDLLARIRMEEGDIPEARRLWQNIATVYPENKAASAALKVIGKRPLNIKWSFVWAALLPIALVAGLIIGMTLSKTTPASLATITWDTLPTQAKIQALSAYKGSVKRVCLSSYFFATPDRLFSRTLLTEAISEALELPTSAIFIGEAPAELSDEAIQVELLQQ